MTRILGSAITALIVGFFTYQLVIHLAEMLP
jgi:hypothetical protein